VLRAIHLRGCRGPAWTLGPPRSQRYPRECNELGSVQWEWQAADGWLGKARFGGKKVGKNPTDRGNKGTKKSVLVEAEGGLLGLAIAGANVPDCKMLRATIEAIVVPRPQPTAQHPPHLSLDKG